MINLKYKYQIMNHFRDNFCTTLYDSARWTLEHTLYKLCLHPQTACFASPIIFPRHQTPPKKPKWQLQWWRGAILEKGDVGNTVRPFKACVTHVMSWCVLNVWWDITMATLSQTWRPELGRRWSRYRGEFRKWGGGSRCYSRGWLSSASRMTKTRGTQMLS